MEESTSFHASRHLVNKFILAKAKTPSNALGTTRQLLEGVDAYRITPLLSTPTTNRAANLIPIAL